MGVYGKGGKAEVEEMVVGKDEGGVEKRGEFDPGEWAEACEGEVGEGEGDCMRLARGAAEVQKALMLEEEGDRGVGGVGGWLVGLGCSLSIWSVCAARKARNCLLREGTLSVSRIWRRASRLSEVGMGGGGGRGRVDGCGRGGGGGGSGCPSRVR